MKDYSHINLMPFQWDAFNGDTFIEKEFLKLKKKFKIKSAIELGTCLGSTTLFLSKNFDKVTTIEINEDFANISKERIEEANCENVQLHIGSTIDVLPSIEITNDTIIFVDSHWLEVCPMQQELEIIASKGVKPIIAIHDFLVPNEIELGYDSIHGQPFEFQWIEPKLDAIYGKEGYTYYYNTSEKSTQIKRGIIYITPKLK
jgi:hypothetical protein